MLAIALLVSGRLIRHALLIGPDGRWRDELWLDGLVRSEEADEPPAREAKPVLKGLLAINTCPVDSLVLLPGVGPVLAARIDETRRRGVFFSSAADLQQVKGIGPALSARLAPHLAFPAGISRSVADSLDGR